MTQQPEGPQRRSLMAFAPLAVLAGIVLAAVLVLTQGRERAFIGGAEGRSVPAFSLTTLSGDDVVSPEEFAGRPYLINLFASWCVPCRAEHPLLMELAAQGVPILGLAHKDEAADTARFLQELGDPYVVVGMDPEGRFSLDLGSTGVPETFVIGPNGEIILAHRQPLTRQAVQDLVLPALEQAAQDP